MAAFSFLIQSDDPIGPEKPPLNFQQISGLHRKDERQLTKLALWAPVLFVPVLVGPFVWEADTLDDAARVAGLMGAIGLGVGYFCVAITLGIWRLSRYGHRGPAGVGLAGKEHAG